MSVTDEIEESLRICQEILNDNPEYVSIKPAEVVISEPVVQEVAQEKKPVEAVREPVVVQEEKPVETVVEPVVQEIAQEEKPVEAVGEPVVVQEEEPVEVTEAEEVEEKGSWKAVLVRLGGCIVVAFFVALIITKFVANHTTVEGSSMDPCLQNGDELIVEKISYLIGDPERFDVIVFEQSEGVNYVKRVIGLPGETVQIKNEKIYVNGRAVFDEYRKERMKNAGIAKNEITLGTDEYFVLGDNRNASKDSRDESVGLIKKDKIRGKAWIRVLPYANFGEIE